MAPRQRVQSVQMDLGNVIFTALVALGFNPASVEQKERTSINEQIFRRMNQKVGDHILHFLFICINHQQAAEVFRDCWPIYDKKTEAQFRSAVFEWFKALNQCEQLNLKSVLVVSKAVVTPTGNKFLATLYTLSRVALHSQVTHLDPSVRLVFLPTLAATRKQRQKAMQLILRSKRHHAFQYIIAIDRRTRLLQLHRDKAKELVDTYRTLVKERENVQQQVSQRLTTLNFISPSMKSTLPTLPFHQFCEELEQSIKSKNEEIGALWTNVSRLQQADAESWPRLSSLLKGVKGLTTINGEDYQMFKQKGKDENCYKEGKLDLVSLFQSSCLVLETLADRVQYNCRPVQEEEARIAELKTRSECVKSLREDTAQMRASLDALLPPLILSVAELRQKLERYFQVQTTSGSFGLCPPTPSLTLENAPRKSKMESSYRLRNLRNNSKVCDKTTDEYVRETTACSSFPMNFSHSLQHSVLLSKQIQQHTDCTSPPLRNTSISASVSSTIDSGCVLSRGADSLMQSIEQLNITPRNGSSLALRRSSVFRKSGSLSLDKSRRVDDTEVSLHESVVAEEKESPIFRQTLAERVSASLNANSVLSPGLGSFSKKMRAGNVVYPERTKLEPGGNRSAIGSFTITTPNVTANYSRGQDAIIQTTNGFLSDLTLNGVGNAEGRLHSSAHEESAIQRRANDKTHTPKRYYTRSPFVAKLLEDLKSEETSNTRRGKRCENISEKSRKDLSCVDGNITRHSISTFTGETSTTGIPSHSRLFPSLVRTSLAVTPAKMNLSFSEDSTFTGEPNDTLTPQTDIKNKKNFYASVASLETLLNQMEDESPPYIWDTVTSKRESPEGSENFVDSRAFLDGTLFVERKQTCREEPLSRFLPQDSVFRTLTESLVSGELESELLLDQEVDAEIRRESLNISRRDSVLSLNVRLSEVSPILLDLLSSS